MIQRLHSDSPGWVRGVMIGRFYILVVVDDFKRFITFGINK